MPSRLFFFLIFMAATLGASVVTGVSCGVEGPPVANSTSCSFSGGLATASSTASYFIAGNTFSVSAFASVGAGAYWGATASSSMTVDFSTAGPIRPGYMINENALPTLGAVGGGGGDVSDSVGFSFYDLTTASEIENESAMYGGGGEVLTGNWNDRVPIELGTTIQFTESGFIFGEGGFAPAYANYTFDAGSDKPFQFFEQDGTTPVDLIAAPEPSGLPLMFLGLMGMAGWKIARRKGGSAANLISEKR